MNPRIISPFAKGQRPSRREDERVEIRAISCRYNEKLSLEADETQFDQRHEDMKRKWE
jgi:hypothetical protein